MKKVFLLLAVLALNLSIAAQEHLAFKGIPIDGTRQSFVKKLKEKGFSYMGEEDGIVMLTGDFAGYKNCLIGVNTLKDKDLVSYVAVIFPFRDTWTQLMSDYNAYKKLLTEKYGEPSDEEEHFNDRYTESSESNSLKMHALHSGEYVWYTEFTTELGRIELTIASLDYDKASVVLRYYDKINTENVKSAIIDDL